MDQLRYFCYFLRVRKPKGESPLPSRTCLLLLVLPAVKQRQSYLQLDILSWQYLYFLDITVIKAHQEFLASASNVVWLVDTIQKQESGLKHLNYVFY